MVRLLSAALLCTSALPAFADEVKLACLTERVWRTAGVPVALMARFDEEAKSASLFARELGGQVQGDGVQFFGDMVGFKFKTEGGAEGSVSIGRVDGSMTLKVSGPQPFSLIATCRKEERRF